MEKRYKPGEFGKKINRSVGTLRLWDRKGKLKANRLPSGQRYYTDEHLEQALNIERKLPEKKILFMQEFLVTNKILTSKDK